jgi:hypothetical protein
MINLNAYQWELQRLDSVRKGYFCTRKSMIEVHCKKDMFCI